MLHWISLSHKPLIHLLASTAMLIGLSLFCRSVYATEERQNYTLQDYSSFWDLNRLTTKEEVIKRFGKPDQVLGTRYFYFNDTFSIFFSKEDTVSTVVVSITKDDLPPPGSIPTSVLERTFIGKHRDAVEEALGPPHDITADDYEYGLIDREVYGGPSVWFTCYDFNEYVCSTFWVNF